MILGPSASRHPSLYPCDFVGIRRHHDAKTGHAALRRCYATLSLDRNEPPAVTKDGGRERLAFSEVRRKEDRSVPDAVGPNKDVLHDPLGSRATKQAQLRVPEPLSSGDPWLRIHGDTIARGQMICRTIGRSALASEGGDHVTCRRTYVPIGWRDAGAARRPDATTYPEPRRVIDAGSVDHAQRRGRGLTACAGEVPDTHRQEWLACACALMWINAARTAPWCDDDPPESSFQGRWHPSRHRPSFM